jgi:TRAP-type C4-dicarboxylate transport system permease large subunit
VVTIPIFFPVVMELGFDPIWFGVIVVLVGEMGVITPPVGVNVFVIKGIAPDIPLNKIFRGILPFLAALVIFTILLLIFPQIATFLPGFISY